ncbi:DUF6377 domain-containing protein [Labilibacter marinus]|uniref:DUF6377 domain-containing protein n=1 Tax=Labilibacter marinus TaxID=1477105 RepID=UPI00094FDC1F|nr:DUF6377 domain-containing protein [Labilibacter marinus]
MARIFLVFVLVFFACESACAQEADLLNQLDEEIKREWLYNQNKENSLDSLKHEVLLNATKGKEWEQFRLYERIANEYSTYVFDSAMLYFRKALDLAYKLNHSKAIAQCQSDYGHLLVSVGYYKEAIDTLNLVSIQHLSSDKMARHYGYLVRAYYDLADYINDDFYAPEYRSIASNYVDSVLLYAEPNTIQPVITKALRFLVHWQPDSAMLYYTSALTDMKPDIRERAVIHSCLGFIQIEMNNTSQGESHLINSAVADLKSSTKEALSLMVLANFLYEQGDVERAYKYILKAKDDAEFFGSKQRKLQVSEIFPAIEGAKLLLEERKKEKAIRSTWLISGLTLIVLVFLLIVYKQLFNLRKIWLMIKQNNKELEALNTQLNEANKIKEKYIGHFFNTGSMFINKIEDISKSMNKLLISNNPQKLKAVLKSINPKKEREQLFHNFDEIFLKIFPTFIDSVEQLINSEEKYVLKPGQLLNTELRILALIRLGVDDNETMAQVLGVSINTIYTYKTKAKNKSPLPTEEFFNKLADIKSV